MCLIALAVRLAVIPFLYHEWMDPFVLEHWAFGRIARSIASGHGFGSPFADTGPSALLPPGLLALWDLLRGRLGLVHLPGHARTLLALLVGLAFGTFLAHP